MAERSLFCEPQDPSFLGLSHSSLKVGNTPVSLRPFLRNQGKAGLEVAFFFFFKEPLNVRDVYYIYKQL